MPREHKSRREVLDAINSIPSMKDLLSMHDGHFDHELDLEVTVYGRNYSGKKVGPYVRLLDFDPGETVISEGEWGGNSFYVALDENLEVLVKAADGTLTKVAEYRPGSEFGQMSVLAGVPRSATVKAKPGVRALVLEVQRPALRLLRKLTAFAESLDVAYRRHGRDGVVEELKEVIGLSDEHAKDLRGLCQFRVFTKNHVLVREAAPMDRLQIINQGWLRRSRKSGPDAEEEDFLGSGFCFGLGGVIKNLSWPYTVTVLGRTEVLELPITKLRQNIPLREALVSRLSKYEPPEFKSRVSKRSEVAARQLTSERRLIDTGLVDATNLLVMDMDLCVRCGNCSMACHQVHGQSRLVRRGIQVTRLESPRPSAIQSVLAPAVCMHCQAPECLTGCPTGAIGRFEAGQIDIEPRTCIGCGDCASQCPYNAISLIARKTAASAVQNGFKQRLSNFLRLSLDALPPAVDATEDLVAVKCNLCSDRVGINPPGAKTQAYSCEENCPTGALARINPRHYFSEIEAIDGPLVLGSRQAAGRNIHRSDPGKRVSHLLGVMLTVILTALAIAGLREYGLGGRLVSFLNLRWITGLAGLAGIAVVMTYPVRRQVYKRRAGPLRYWLLSHTYAGVIAGVMILLHGGSNIGGPLTAALMISFDLVILTGLLGILLYVVVPRLLTKIEASPLLIDDLVRRQDELKKDLASVLASASPALRKVVEGRVVPRFLSFGFLIRQFVKREPLGLMISRATGEFKSALSQLDEPDRAKLERAVESAATLRRVDALVYLHRSLKLWLPPHVVTTSVMLALMLVHIVQVTYYAAR